MDSDSKRADFQHEIEQALKKHTWEGVEFMLGCVGIIASDNDDLNVRRLAEIITADISDRF